jgi:predicted dehydrogenase
MAKKKLNIAIIGGGFMGRTHSNAFRQAPEFFALDHQPVLKAVCTRNAKGAADFAANWGFESSESDWRKLIDRKDIDLIDIASPNDTHAEIAVSAAPPPRRRRWSPQSSRPRSRTWSGTTTGACRR